MAASPGRHEGSASEWWHTLTVVVPSSPVPSNPSTRALRALFVSLFKVPGLPKAQKLIHLDGPQRVLPEPRRRDYLEFVQRVRALVRRGNLTSLLGSSASSADGTSHAGSTESVGRAHEAFLNTRVYLSERFLFSAHNLAAAVELVRTQFMLVMQHDFHVARPFDARGLLRTMQENGRIKHVRLNARANIAVGFDSAVENYTGHTHVPLARTCGWSDAAHFASRAYYLTFVIPLNKQDHNGGARKFLEESVHYRMMRNGGPGGCFALKKALQRGEASPPWPKDFDDFGTYLYGYASAFDGKYMMHHSLRGHLPQWGLEDEKAPGKAVGARSRLRERKREKQWTSRPGANKRRRT